MKIRKIMTAITATAMAGVMFAGCSSSNGGSIRRKQRGQRLRSGQQLRSGQRRRRE